MAGSTVVIKYNNVDITNKVIFESATFELQMSAIPGTFEIQCKDTSQSLSFVTGKEITLDIDGKRMFGGYIMQVSRAFAFPADKIPGSVGSFRNRIWILRGVDYNVLFDRRILRNTSDYLKQIPSITSAVYDGAIIRTYWGTYFDLSGVNLTTHVDDIHQFPRYTWEQQGSKLRESLEDLQQFSGALAYIDGSKYLWYREIDTTVKRWGFSDVPNNAGITSSPTTYQNATIGPREITGAESITAMVNDAFVWGGSPYAGAGGTVFSRTQDTGSQTTHGRWQLAETHFGEEGYGIQAGVDVRSDIIVNGPPGAVAGDQNRGLKYPQWELRLAWFAHDVPMLSGAHDHLIPGELSTITLWSYSEDGGTTPYTILLPLRSVRISFPELDPDGNAYVRFDGFFGLQPDDPYTLWRFFLKQRKVVETIVAVDNTSTASAPGAIYQGVPTPSANGSATVFTIPFAYISGTTTVYKNGLVQRRNADYTESGPSSGQITFTVAPANGAQIYVEARVAT